MPNQETDLAIVEYGDLIDDDSSLSSSSKTMMDRMDKAFGPNGIGILAVRNVPNFVEFKLAVLNQAHPLAHLPSQELRELEDPNSLYNAGWSHGKEMLKPGKPDTAKGSFYFNPIIDVPDPKDRELYPVSYPINRWPKQSLPTLEPAAKRLGRLLKEVAVHVSKHIDAYAQSRNSHYPSKCIYNSLINTEKVKGRLLYYFPLPETQTQSEDSWIGWHNDSGFLTALAGDIYMDKEGTPVVPPPSSSAGLYVVDRNNRVCKVSIPADCMAIQIGECTQIMTGGAVIATPHCVRGVPNLARASLACFIDVPPVVPLSLPPGGATPESIMAMESDRVPTMAKRWKDGMKFGEFLQKTFEAYYNKDG